MLTFLQKSFLEKLTPFLSILKYYEIISLHPNNSIKTYKYINLTPVLKQLPVVNLKTLLFMASHLSI